MSYKLRLDAIGKGPDPGNPSLNGARTSSASWSRLEVIVVDDGSRTNSAGPGALPGADRSRAVGESRSRSGESPDVHAAIVVIGHCGRSWSSEATGLR